MVQLNLNEQLSFYSANKFQPPSIMNLFPKDVSYFIFSFIKVGVLYWLSKISGKLYQNSQTGWWIWNIQTWGFQKHLQTILVCIFLAVRPKLLWHFNMRYPVNENIFASLEINWPHCAMLCSSRMLQTQLLLIFQIFEPKIRLNIFSHVSWLLYSYAFLIGWKLN